MKRSHPTNAFRRIAALCLAMACLLLAVHSEPAETTGAGIPGRWSAEKANAWYDNQPWPCGFNYIPANAISYTEMWMPYCFDPELIDRELALAGGIGFNCLRVVLPFVVWDLYNEPTHSGTGELAIALAERVFRWARAVNPTQPLTLGEWNDNKKLNDVIHRNSDIVTFHSYNNAEKLAEQIRALKEHGRPVINTEWLNRPRGSTVADCLPLFARENVGCMHWGLVNGKTQTDLGWGARPGRPEPEVWQHDLFHGDHTPYDRKELDLFRRTIGKSRAAAAGRTK